ncbi:hypothetical protein N2384_11830 [Bacillus paralicheniformis]|uniref:AMP-binding enzyme n=1 Tax=Bacillus paralicheniformis TaxID=1648923 RepID=UPI0021A8F740|nr:hypothetical protein [Bacillus paralicheniformis]UWS63429.1 hypothetical protein N2384_11830 [Bacillus paralicheniformis]
MNLATVDEEGYLTIQGRIKNIIVVKEMNVSPEHVEQALRQCGGIRDAAVVGIPHKNGGSRLVALLLAEESGYSLERVKQHAREHLEPASRPSQYRVMDAHLLPGTEKHIIQAIANRGEDRHD